MNTIGKYTIAQNGWYITQSSCQYKDAFGNTVISSLSGFQTRTNSYTIDPGEQGVPSGTQVIIALGIETEEVPMLGTDTFLYVSGDIHTVSYESTGTLFNAKFNVTDYGPVPIINPPHNTGPSGNGNPGNE